MKKYKAIGLMSGTSLDGLDIAACRFELKENSWDFSIECAETVAYDEAWKKKLASLTNASGFDLMKTHVELGRLFGQATLDFINRNGFSPDLIASHGHTVFHQPHIGFTLQIGSGYEILKACQTKVVCDFRSLDVALGGQGAPLVPVGDKLLFSEYDFCLNLGGISNISFEKDGKRIAFDIAPHNIVLNRLSKILGFDFDDKGKIAETGKFAPKLFETLNSLGYYKRSFPKSLGIESIEREVFPVIDRFDLPVEDKLHTFNLHAAWQIDKEIRKAKSKREAKVLITGGGVYNRFFVEQLKMLAAHEHSIVVPDKLIIDFKEALVFAFLGVLRLRQEANALRSVTGASRDNCGGVVLG